MNKKSGLSMGGTIENTRNVKAVKSKCSKCYHRKYYKHSKKGTYYCDFYKIDYPNKSYCKRFYELEPLSREEINLVKQHNEEIKRKRKEANTPKKTTLEKISTVLGCSLTEQEIFSNNKRNQFKYKKHNSCNRCFVCFFFEIMYIVWITGFCLCDIIIC